MIDQNYTNNSLMYYVHSTIETNNTTTTNNNNNNNSNNITNTMTQPHDMYYSPPSLPGSSAIPIIPSPSEMDLTSHTMQQQPLALSMISNPSLPITTTTAQGQVFDHHPQELSPQDPSIYSVPSSVIDEDVSSGNSASVTGYGNGNGNNGGQEAYIQQLQKQVEDSKHLQTQYYYRIEQLMALVEKQTARINELQEQVSQTVMHDHGGGGGDGFRQQQQQQQQQYSLQQTPSIQHHH